MYIGFPIVSGDESCHCAVCGAVTNSKKFTVPGATFFELEDAPFICSKCLFKTWSGQTKEWKKKYLDEDLIKWEKHVPRETKEV